MSVIEQQVREAIGAKGGGKGGGGDKARAPREAPNTLRSAATARVIDLLGEGEIRGLVNGLQSIYFDDTPIQNEDGTFNFQGVQTHFRAGLPDQEPLPGQKGVERELLAEAVEITADTPVVRTITNLDADAARLTVQLPSLSYQEEDTGDLRGSSVEIAIDVRPSGGTWLLRRADRIAGKTTSPYQRAYRVDLVGAGPWDVRVRRITADSDQVNLRNETYLALFTELVDAKLIYPDSALIGIEVDAQQFGSTVPARKYDVYGNIIPVPSNYDPDTREYSGLWDGTFKLAWTDSPAWWFYNLATHTRYGANIPYCDKWSLYNIGQYCDGLVDDGFGGLEPRFTFNTVIADQSDVHNALAQLASVFRGMVYWGSNTIMPVADMPSEPVKLVTPANVIDGEFEYSGASLSSRHSVALVSYNDPDSNDRLVPEVVEDPELIEQFGWVPLQINAVACNSRGQAHRVGAWALDSEKNEGETLSYRAGSDHADVRPGELIRQTDPSRAGARLGGRLTATGTGAVTLDKVPPETSDGHTWYLDAMLPTGQLERREVQSFSGNDVTLVNPFSAQPVQAAVWILSSQSVEPRLWRIVGNVERDGEYVITGVEHDPTKYARVEQGIQLPRPENSLIPTGRIGAPSSVSVESYTYIAGGTQHQGLSVSWTPSDDPRVVRYICEAQGPTDSNWRTLSTDAGTSADLTDAAPGQWQVRVKSMSGLNQPSGWVSKTVYVNGLLLPAAPVSCDLDVGTFSITLTPHVLTPGATWEVWMSFVALQADEIESNAQFKGEGSSIAVPDLDPGTDHFFYIRGKNVYGTSAFFPTQATTDNDPSAILKNLTDQITKTQLYSELTDEIELITAPASVAGSVNDRLSVEQQARIDAIADEADERSQGDTQVYADAQTYADTESAAAQTVSQVVATFGGNAADALTYTVNQVDSQLAVTQRLDALRADYDGIDTSNYATTSQLASAQADDEQARADLKTVIEADYNGKFDDDQQQINNRATLTQLSDAQADNAGARSQLETSLQADYNGKLSSKASITYVDSAVLNADYASATQLNQLKASLDSDLTTWADTYVVSRTISKKLKNADGSTPLAAPSSNYNVYEVSGVVRGTSVDTDAIAQFKIARDASVDMAWVNQPGPVSNNIRFFIDSDGDPAVALYDPANNQTYAVDIEIKRYLTGTSPQSALITNNNAVILDPDYGPFAQATKQVSVSDGGGSATIQEQFTAQRSELNGLNATWTLRVSALTSDGRPYLGGFGLGAEGGVVRGIWDVDEFAVGRSGKNGVFPFIISGENTYIRKAAIEQLTATDISTNSLAAFSAKLGTVTSGNLLISSDTASSQSHQIALRSDVYLPLWYGPGNSYTEEDALFAVTSNGRVIMNSADVIDTLQIKGNAVTLPMTSYMGSPLVTSNFTSGTYKSAVTSIHVANPKNTTAQIQVSGLYNSRGNTGAAIWVRVTQKRSGYSFQTMYESRIDYQDNGSIHGPLFIRFQDYSLIPGVATDYYVDIKFVTNGGDEIRELSEASISFIGFWK